MQQGKQIEKRRAPAQMRKKLDTAGLEFANPDHTQKGGGREQESTGRLSQQQKKQREIRR